MTTKAELKRRIENLEDQYDQMRVRELMAIEAMKLMQSQISDMLTVFNLKAGNKSGS